MTASERMDEIETTQAETNAALAELRRMTEEKKTELENVILRESLATSNERYTTLKTEQDAALQRMNSALNESAKRLENGMSNLAENVKQANGAVSESVRRMSAAVSESVATEVSRVKETSAAAIREISKASGEAAREYQRLFNEAQQKNAAEFDKLMKRRNTIDLIVCIVAAISFAFTGVFMAHFFGWIK